MSAPLLTQYLIQTRPDIPGFKKVRYARQTVVIGCFQETTQVLKRRHCFHWPVICPKRHHYPPPKTSIPIDAIYSSPIPVNIGSFLGGGSSAPPKVQTCHRMGSEGGGGSLTPQSLLCPARGGAQSGSGGRCLSFTSPQSPLPGTQWTW